MNPQTGDRPCATDKPFDTFAPETAWWGRVPLDTEQPQPVREHQRSFHPTKNTVA